MDSIFFSAECVGHLVLFMLLIRHTLLVKTISKVWMVVWAWISLLVLVNLGRRVAVFLGGEFPSVLLSTYWILWTGSLSLCMTRESILVKRIMRDSRSVVEIRQATERAVSPELVRLGECADRLSRLADRIPEHWEERGP